MSKIKLNSSFVLKFLIDIIRSDSLLYAITNVLRIGNGFFILPIALRCLPKEQLGLNYTFTAVLSLVGLLDFGMAPTLNRFAAYAWGGAKSFKSIGLPEMSLEKVSNNKLILDLLNFAKNFYTIFAIFLGVVLFLIGGIYFYHQIIENGLSVILLGCWFVVAAGSAWGVAKNFYWGILGGIGEVRKALKINIYVKLVCLIVLLIGLLLGWELWSYSVSAFAGAIVNGILGEYEIKKKIGTGLAKFSFYIDKKLFCDFWATSWRTGVSSVGGFCIVQANVILCTSKLGLSETASYGLTLQAFSVISALSLSPLSVFWPKLSMLRVQQENKRVLRIFLSQLFKGMGLFIFGSISLVVIGPFFLNLIGSKTCLLSVSIIVIQGFILLLDYNHTQWSNLMLTGNRNPFVLLTIFSGLGVLAASFILVDYWGVFGLIIAQGFVQLLGSNWIPVVFAIRDLKK